MFIIPAIDIINKKCVRLTQGMFSQVTTYNTCPIEMAKQFERDGAKLLHVVDLEGAKAGKPTNTETILAISRAVSIPLQAGGGIRSYESAKRLLSEGIERIVLSTIFIENPQLLEKLVNDFGCSHILVSLDIKNNKVAINGWTKEKNKSISNIISILKTIGIKTVIVTDTSKDGLLQGPNFKLTSKFISEGFETIAAGGISSIGDIKELYKCGAYGVIVGKALYEGRLDLKNLQHIVRYRNNLTKRIIPCLDVRDGRVVKGTHFKDLKDAGNPVELGEMYSKLGADELIFLDIDATIENRAALYNLVEQVAQKINIPFTVGGGVKSIEDIRALLKCGADKVSIGSAAVLNPNLLREVTKCFGSQCIVVSIDAKRKGNKWNVYIKGGREKTNIDVVKFAKQVEELGVGEILVNSLDRDGTKEGFDLELLNTISKNVNIPVIASSGAGSKEDFLDVFKKTNVDAALGASVFHYKEIDIISLKEFLSGNNISVRL